MSEQRRQYAERPNAPRREREGHGPRYGRGGVVPAAARAGVALGLGSGRLATGISLRCGEWPEVKAQLSYLLDKPRT